ncbi:BgTH12-03094 [Blumeria graminis f. sp. triticale]|uniref:Bgt-20912 n=3 Tax=Blumeria graminis TaxID=34373 RepID=A0A381LIS0_BLUGR|nr:BgTH12-03094 [Blumeria graminis f. sp. triticale]VDB89518.1 Bgt-20912 [Blumeria graminis f. sp. tritici]
MLVDHEGQARQLYIRTTIVDLPTREPQGKAVIQIGPYTPDRRHIARPLTLSLQTKKAN